MRVCLYFDNPRDVDMVRPIVQWLDKYLVFVDNPKCAGLCKKYKLKYRYIKDYRLLVWEMARWQPSVFVDLSLRPYMFPRNGSINVLIPNRFRVYLNDNLKFYDYILVSNKYNKIDMERFGIPIDRLKIVGYPRFDLAVRGEKVLLHNSERKVLEKYQETRLRGSNSGLKIASFIKKAGERNRAIYTQPDLTVVHRQKINKKEQSYEENKTV